MNDEASIAMKRDQHRRSSFIRLVFELFVVFVGVWAALLAENWRQRREDARAAVAVLETAVAQLRESRDWAGRWSDSVGVEYDKWKARRAHGEVIAPFFMRIPGSESPPVGIFEAASNLPDVLGPSIAAQMAIRANEMEGLGRRNARYMESTERTVFPLLAADPSVFYDAASGELLPQFQGQLLLMEELLDQWAVLQEQGDQLATLLEGELSQRQRGRHVRE